MNTISVQINLGTGSKNICSVNSPITINELWNHVETSFGLPKNDFYVIHNGHLGYDDDICNDGLIKIIPRLCGGKGGFGSMLRAIGAQIEKTTNREACRDLSGRRLRDINEEKRLKAWIEKQTKREEEAAERKKKKLQKLVTEPKHEFKDQVYERERSILTERVGDAVDEGFKVAVASTSGVKRKAEAEFKSNKRKQTILDMDMDSDELDTDDSEGEIESDKICKTKSQVSNDSGHSSDESDKTNKSMTVIECKQVEVECKQVEIECKQVES